MTGRATPLRFGAFVPQGWKLEYTGVDAAAAWALLEGANAGDSYGAELATGYRWGESRLRPHVERILKQAKDEGNERLEQLAQRFLG